MPRASTAAKPAATADKSATNSLGAKTLKSVAKQSTSVRTGTGRAKISISEENVLDKVATKAAMTADKLAKAVKAAETKAMKTAETKAKKAAAQGENEEDD